MSQYSITHTCGHSETVQLYGPGKDRDRKSAWLESKPCRDCERDALNEKHAAENEAAAKAASEAGLPALTGSEKQVAWAATIRQNILEGMPAGTVEGLPEYLQDPYAEFARWLTGQTSASWWIDHRERSVQDAIANPRMPELLMTVFSGHGDATTWQDLLAAWVQKNYPAAVEQMKADNAREAEERTARAAENAAKLNEIIERAAAAITEADCEYDGYGNWRGTTFEGYRFRGLMADTVDEITAPNGVTARGLNRQSGLPALSALGTRIAQLTAARRRRLQAERNAAIQAGHVVSVVRTRVRDNNTIATLDNGITITATVARKDDDWGMSFKDAARTDDLKDAYARIGREAEQWLKERGNA